MSYSEDEKVRAAAWKQRTGALPAEAKVPACYIDQNGNSKARPVEFCLPAPYAALSLLPEVRAQALVLFAELGIPWHAGVDGGPSNHLVSSQVQCVNALGQMVSDPERIRRAFGHALGIDEVLRIEPGRYLTFEYIGPADFFGEVPGGDRIRGAHCTSVDAAFLHRAVDGVIELVLVEWKYTESYRVRKPSPAKDAVRLNRYGQAVNESTGPIRGELLPFELLLDEPIYQLVRQQLLAHALEQAGAEGAGRVRVVHVLSPDNGAYQKSIARPEQLALGGTVAEIWHKLLRHPDRFVSVDSKLFLDPEITSREYVLRHARDVVHDQDELLSAFDLARSGDLEDILCTDHEYDGNVRVINTASSLSSAGRAPGSATRSPSRTTRTGRGARGRTGMKIEVVLGDITVQEVDAIVTAGNSALRGGSGVNGAVHAAAGPRLLRASRALAPSPAGSAVITPAFDLAPVKWVIHAVGPIFTGPADDAILAAAYTSSLTRADEAQTS